MVTSLICAGFSSVACYNFLLSAHQNPPSLDANLQQLHRVLPSSQRWKYTLMSAFTICGGLYGAAHLAVPYAQASYQSDRLWYKFISFISSDINYQHVFTWTKEEMNLTYPQVFEEHVVFAYSLPLIGILVFSLFGLGPEIRRVYVERMRALEILLTESRLSSWLKTQVSKVEWRRLYHRLISSMLSCVGRLNDVRIAIQGAVVDRWPGRRQVDPNQFTPFRTDDIILDDFLAPLNSSGRRDDAIFGRGPLLPLSPPTVLPPPPAASSSKRQPVLGPTWREYRKGPLPGTVVHGEVNEDFQRQPGTSTKAAKRSMQPRPAYVVYRKGSL
ncbi:hypothetical protein FRC17_007474 [Serendipita sp. 399]|nr:hypothetical protein FRC17_007474 [Serendipita sp. 399]